MNTELEIITPHLRGSCVTIDNRIHGLFKLTGGNRAAAEQAWTLVRNEPHDQAALTAASQTAARR
jgi:hypothetical protein